MSLVFRKTSPGVFDVIYKGAVVGRVWKGVVGWSAESLDKPRRTAFDRSRQNAALAILLAR